MENKAEANATEENAAARETPPAAGESGNMNVPGTSPSEAGGEASGGTESMEVPGPESAADLDALKVLEARLMEAENAQKAANDRYMRTVAELENFRKRTARETEEFRKYANTALVQKLLPSLDNMERAMESAGVAEASAKVIVEGLRMTLADILKIFSEFNVRPVEAEGRVFDPVYHMAVAHEETDAADPDTVIRVFQKGYIMHDRLIRPAMVSVAKARTVPAGQDGNSAAE